jgi:hypothetical protein
MTSMRKMESREPHQLCCAEHEAYKAYSRNPPNCVCDDLDDVDAELARERAARVAAEARAEAAERKLEALQARVANMVRVIEWACSEIEHTHPYTRRELFALLDAGAAEVGSDGE